MSKPDSAGLWVSEEGHVALGREGQVSLIFACNDASGRMVSCPQGTPALYVSELPDYRWQKVDVPKPEFPAPKPAIVYAKTKFGDPRWWMVGDLYCYSTGGGASTSKFLLLVDHPEQPENAEELLNG